MSMAALEVMHDSVMGRGGRKLDDDGRMLQGIIVRHLVMPTHADDSCEVLNRVWNLCHNDVDVSIMNQYTPNERMRAAGGPLSGTLSDEEYELVLCHADDLGFENLWWQEGGTVSESFVPAFDATGVEGPALKPRSPRGAAADSSAASNTDAPTITSIPDTPTEE